MSKAFLVAGLAWGDEGKGAAVDYLCRKHDAKLIVRYNGGSQAAHNVVLPDGRHHTFAQFGSGSFIPGIRTHLSRFMMINPVGMLYEADALKPFREDIFKDTSVDERCLITTPLHKAMNRIREQNRGRNSHGSCGLGVGETRSYDIYYPDCSLKARDLFYPELALEKLEAMQARFRAQCTNRGQESLLVIPEGYMDSLRQWAERVQLVYGMVLKGCTHNIVFEGAQGVLLDERDEFAPHNTWTNTTFQNAETLLEEAKFTGDIIRVGCLRSYMTRHGKGPFSTEDINNKHLQNLCEPHNNGAGFQGEFRRGHFNMSMVKRALDICGGVDEIHMSHCDQLPQIYEDCHVDQYVNNIERLLETPITVLSYGPTHEDRKERDVKGIVARRRSIETGDGVSRCTTGST